MVVARYLGPLGARQMSTPESLIAQLFRVFPQRRSSRPAAPHASPECLAICAVLDAKTWAQVPPELVLEKSGALPLLSPDAYRAFIPAWLREGILDPKGDVATTVLINLRDDPNTNGFTRAEARAIIDTAKYIGTLNSWEPDDSLNAEAVTAIDRLWSEVEA
jgi:hypothetical protein